MTASKSSSSLFSTPSSNQNSPDNNDPNQSSSSNNTNSPSTGIVTLSTWTRGKPLLTTGRNEMDVTLAYGVIQPEDRVAMAPKDLLRHQEAIVKGLPNKFKLLVDFDPDAPMDALKNVYSVENLVSALKRSFASNGMLSEFMIPSTMEYTNATGYQTFVPGASATQINLFHHYGETELLRIKQFCAFLSKFGPSYQLENLQWGAEKILNSCEDNLRDKILEITKDFSEFETGSIVVYKVMMTLVISSTSAAIRTLTKKLETLKLTDFDGENVSTATSFVRGAVALMKSNKAVPTDIEDMTFTIFKYCSTEDFVSHVNFLSNLRLYKGLQSIDNMSYDGILLSLENKYTDLKGQEKWMAKITPTESALVGYDRHSNPGGNGSTPGQDTRNKNPCFNCEKPGCTPKTCDQALNPDRIAANRKKFKDKKKAKDDSSSNDTSSPNDTPNGSSTIDLSTTPPKEGGKLVRVIGQRGAEKIVHWCKTCHKWGDHLTENHPNTQSANTANGSNGNGNTPPPPPPPTNSSNDSSPSETATYSQMVGNAVRNSLRPDF